MARFLLITYALEQTLIKLGLYDSEEFNPLEGLDAVMKYLNDFNPPDGLAAVMKYLKEDLPSVQALIRDTEERLVGSLLSSYFLDLQEHVAFIEYSLDQLAIHGMPTSSTADRRILFARVVVLITPSYLESVSVVLNRISQSLEEIRSNKQQVESSGLGVISDDVKTVGRGDDVLKIVEFLKGSTNHQLLHVFPIVGMAGLGKTALARLVCEAVSEGQLFDETVWISVSDNFEELTVLREMLKDLGVPC